MSGVRPNTEFAKEWLDSYVETIVLFMANCTMSNAQLRKILAAKIEELGVEIDEY